MQIIIKIGKATYMGMYSRVELLSGSRIEINRFIEKIQLDCTKCTYFCLLCAYLIMFLIYNFFLKMVKWSKLPMILNLVFNTTYLYLNNYIYVCNVTYQLVRVAIRNVKET
jgi:hypothetical protein